MKTTIRISFLTLLMIAGFFVSCEEEIIDPTGIIGDWQVDNLAADRFKLSGLIGGLSISTDASLSNQEVNLQYSFRADSTYSTTGGFSATLNFVFQGDTLSQDIQENDLQSSGTWSLAGNLLTLVSAIDSSDIRLLEVSDQMENTMNLSTEYEQTFSLTEGEFTVKGDLVEQCERF